MNVIVDTCIWSEALRKPQKPASASIIHELKELIMEGRVVMLGVVRQEILSGIRNHEQFARLRDKLRAFKDYPVSTENYEFAAELFNQCRASGIQGSNTDFLICAVAIPNGLSVFTTDKDFHLFAKHTKIHLHLARQ